MSDALTSLDFLYAVEALERELRTDRKLLADLEANPVHAALVPGARERFAAAEARVARFRAAQRAAIHRDAEA